MKIANGVPFLSLGGRRHTCMGDSTMFCQACIPGVPKTLSFMPPLPYLTPVGDTAMGEFKAPRHLFLGKRILS